MRTLTILLTSAALLACGGGVKTGTSGTSGSSGSSGGTTGTATITPCTNANPCPNGQFCFNGVCALGCTSDGNCASNQYCDTASTGLCQDISVPTCGGDSQCASSQVCSTGFCSTPPPTTVCNVTLDGSDGCNAYSICVQNTDNSGNATTNCQSYPACARDGSCPKGTMGAVCNDDYITGKDRVCLAGLCAAASSDCPTNWKCIKANPNDVLGQCSDGSFGQACDANADCQNNHCTTFPTGGGVCF